MTDYSARPDSNAERLIGDVFARLERQADPVIARLRLERRLKEPPRRSRVSTVVKVLAFLTGLVLLGGWASQARFSPWDDGQLITLEAPAGFVPASYPYWVAVFANQADELYGDGGHSLVVDYRLAEDGTYYLQLGIIGANYSVANEWLRGVMAEVPELGGRPYSITQPLLPYTVSLREMIAFGLFGDTAAEEQRVVQAWRAIGERPRHIYLIAGSAEYAKRTSTVGH